MTNSRADRAYVGPVSKPDSSREVPVGAGTHNGLRLIMFCRTCLQKVVRFKLFTRT